ncbi:hypothetical protein [Oricola cellulosilytica]|uniref:Uncharacterized protein n=1 Tax=Oricola cellulosilytica TaxID=1429082 RepID=A0A4R0PBR9_9HYPH|nr:hypothetical protein [Oricola cellulosilytica]TCD14496.1 hypothetical protein E0D97_10585 [Oricola cellulosilytica]
MSRNVLWIVVGVLAVTVLVLVTGFIESVGNLRGYKSKSAKAACPWNRNGGIAYASRSPDLCEEGLVLPRDFA